MLLCTTAHLTYCDHIAAQIRNHTIADHSMLYSAYSWICQSCIVQSTFNRGVARTWATRAQARVSIIRDTLIEQSDRDISVSVFREAV